MTNTLTSLDAPVLTERRGHIFIITLNRPAVRNAINVGLAKGLAAALDVLDRDDELRVAVLAGAGPGFCAGMDLKAFAADGEWPVIDGRGFGGCCERSSDKPLIAAIEGFAIAGGLEVALSCDMLVAARGARMGTPEVKRGLAAGAGALIRLPKRIPYHVAMELALTGEPITSERAHALGLVNVLCEPGEALETALRVAQGIAENAPIAVRASKHIVRGSIDWPEDVAWAEQASLIDGVRRSEDATEGASAFAEKRAPHWKGR
ncbi:crotonase/enoyl-CoA hydratase family protein [Dechloromonas agitata]|uniref:crotonase/enoyl-CoA hydratase family protein n=1 Tax=Dechloromonas agitata TaxID=73030 RepID=UPI00237E2326|nr:crotonase/enoyl-CoA hydratase family protein [Dechloromonas agitata]MDE1544073.1 crotonase/enoyl-CoA hydratase family protein [Dechloromonas agitata]